MVAIQRRKAMFGHLLIGLTVALFVVGIAATIVPAFATAGTFIALGGGPLVGSAALACHISQYAKSQHC